MQVADSLFFNSELFSNSGSGGSSGGGGWTGLGSMNGFGSGFSDGGSWGYGGGGSYSMGGADFGGRGFNDFGGVTERGGGGGGDRYDSNGFGPRDGFTSSDKPQSQPSPTQQKTWEREPDPELKIVNEKTVTVYAKKEDLSPERRLAWENWLGDHPEMLDTGWVPVGTQPVYFKEATSAVRALPPDPEDRLPPKDVNRPLPSYGDLLARNAAYMQPERRYYATEAEFNAFWAEEQKLILKTAFSPIADAIDLPRAVYERRWRDAAMDGLSVFGGKILDGVATIAPKVLSAKWAATILPFVRYAGDVVQTPLGQTVGFRSYSSWLRVMGKAGPGMEWHHIVEQKGPNAARFAQEWLHNEINLVKVSVPRHREINRIYSSGMADGRTFRQYVSSLPYERQHEIGMNTLRQVQERIP